MRFSDRYDHHLVGGNSYIDQYGYDINHLYEWSVENDPTFMSMEILLSYDLNVYGHIVSAALTLNVPSVLDIGCGCGQQSKMFAESDIDYIGVDPDVLPFYGEGRPGCSILYGTYPDCGNPGVQAGISSHCMGTALLWEPEAIADDFDVFIGHCYQDFFEELKEFYPNFEIIEVEDLMFHPEAPRVPMEIAACWR